MIIYLLILLIQIVQSTQYGIYTDSSISKSGINCLRNLGFNGFIVQQGYYGEFNEETNTTENYNSHAGPVNQYALESGFTSTTIEMTLQLCYNCGGYRDQIISFLNDVKFTDLHFKILWIVIDETLNGNEMRNRAILEVLATELPCDEYYCGIKCSKQQWKQSSPISLIPS